MANNWRLTIRSVPTESRNKLRALQVHTHLPQAILIADAIAMLWEAYEDDMQGNTYPHGGTVA